MSIQQTVIDRAVDIAVKATLNGNPVKRITWIPRLTPAQDPIGAFAIEYYSSITATTYPGVV